jgi:hypothetical protein
MTDIPAVYIGFDRREPEATRVARHSLLATSSIELKVFELNEIELRARGLYDRPYRVEGQQRIDERDGKPFSTDFSFTRFLVPALQNYRGWAMYCDSDFLFRADVADLFALAEDKYAVMCVKHDHRPKEKLKMDQQRQELYRRKNWSSMILYNCAHPANAALTPEMVNHSTGGFLHAFSWLDDDLIGGLPETWNWLEGWSSPALDPHIVHMTRGRATKTSLTPTSGAPVSPTPRPTPRPESCVGRSTPRAGPARAARRWPSIRRWRARKRRSTPATGPARRESAGRS